MIEKTCNLWSEPAAWRCIPTIGALGSDGAAVMDAGVALEATQRYHHIEYDLGRLLASRGNHVHVLRPGLASFPIKQFAWSGLSLDIIGRSARELVALVGDAKTLLPRPLSPNENVPWEQIANVLSFMPDNIVVIQHT